jgi:hypothetical protein
VDSQERGRGLGRRLIETILEGHHGPVDAVRRGLRQVRALGLRAEVDQGLIGQRRVAVVVLGGPGQGRPTRSRGTLRPPPDEDRTRPEATQEVPMDRSTHPSVRRSTRV